MTSHEHDRIMTLGFVMAYVGVLGLLLLMSSPNLSEAMERLIRLGLASMAVFGAIAIAAGKLLPRREN